MVEPETRVTYLRNQLIPSNDQGGSPVGCTLGAAVMPLGVKELLFGFNS